MQRFCRSSRGSTSTCGRHAQCAGSGCHKGDPRHIWNHKAPSRVIVCSLVPCMVWYGGSIWRIAVGRSVQVRRWIGTVSLGRHCGQAGMPSSDLAKRFQTKPKNMKHACIQNINNPPRARMRRRVCSLHCTYAGLLQRPLHMRLPASSDV